MTKKNAKKKAKGKDKILDIVEEKRLSAGRDRERFITNIKS